MKYIHLSFHADLQTLHSLQLGLRLFMTFNVSRHPYHLHLSISRFVKLSFHLLPFYFIHHISPSVALLLPTQSLTQLSFPRPFRCLIKYPSIIAVLSWPYACPPHSLSSRLAYQVMTIRSFHCKPERSSKPYSIHLSFVNLITVRNDRIEV